MRTSGGTGAAVDLWWSEGGEERSEGDTPIHCRATDLKSGLPPAWRKGARGRMVESVLQHYAAKARPDAAVSAGQWRLNGGRGLHISLSDTGSYYCVGVGQNVPIGIDAERIRPLDDAMATLNRLGMSGLSARLSPLPPKARQRAFFMIWTAFEAYLKLERLKWDAAAARITHLSAGWTISGEGRVHFGVGARSGLIFKHLEPHSNLLVAVVCPVDAPIAIRSVSAAAPRYETAYK